MGRSSLLGMREVVVNEDETLMWHLQYNHFPPVPLFMVSVAKRALKAIREGNHERKVQLPKGVTSSTYGKRVPAWKVVEELHLDGFLD